MSTTMASIALLSLSQTDDPLVRLLLLPEPQIFKQKGDVLNFCRCWKIDGMLLVCLFNVVLFFFVIVRCGCCCCGCSHTCTGVPNWVLLLWPSQLQFDLQQCQLQQPDRGDMGELSVLRSVRGDRMTGDKNRESSIHVLLSSLVQSLPLQGQFPNPEPLLLSEGWTEHRDDHRRKEGNQVW